MARARNIKPGFFENELLAELGAFDRLLFLGLWTLADREGRLEDRPKRIKIKLFPGDDYDVERGLEALAGKGFISRYQVEGYAVVEVCNFLKHQKPHGTEKDSTLPDANGFLTVNERGKGGCVTGNKRLIHVNGATPTEPNNVNPTLDNGSLTVDSTSDNALILRFTDSPNQEQEQPLPLRGGSDQLRDRLLSLLARRFSADTATDLHNEVQDFLEGQGFECVREYPVEDRGDGRPGRVDLVVKGDDGSLCGIELDRDTPRDKSLFKLAQLPSAIVLLRSPYNGPDCIDGIAVVSGVSAQPAPPPGRKKRAPAFDAMAAKPDNVSAKVWAEWVQHRREIRKPLTETSCARQAAQLATCPSPDAVILESIANGWQGLFPGKSSGPPSGKPSNFTNLPKHTPDSHHEEPDHDGPNF